MRNNGSELTVNDDRMIGQQIMVVAQCQFAMGQLTDNGT